LTSQIDTAYNCVPSLHAALTCLVLIAMWDVRHQLRCKGAPKNPSSTNTKKDSYHTIIDGINGMKRRSINVSCKTKMLSAEWGINEVLK
jgi:hypothetical protein